MDSKLQKPAEESEALQKVEGRPNESTAEESNRFGRFWSLMTAKLAAPFNLASRFLTAEVERREGMAERNIQQAAKLACEAEKAHIEAATAKAKAVRESLESLDPKTRDAVTLATLIQDDPELANQISKVKKILRDLRENKGATVEFLNREIDEPTE